jgi:sulfate adenylyltransferase
MPETVQAEIAPHGGRLIDRAVPPPARPEERARAERLPSIPLSTRAANDLLLIANGAFSPLEGFMTYDAARSVVYDLALPGGTVWSLPVLLQVDSSVAEGFAPGKTVALRYAGSVLGTLRIEERFAVPREWAREVFKTEEEVHPGVAAFRSAGGTALAGPIEWVGDPHALKLDGNWHTPLETRAEFARRGWRRVAGFQTRNPIHRAHEYVLRTTLEVTDGLLLHPLVGETRPEDVPADLRLRCYRVLLDHYLPSSRIVFSVLPAWMRYAGPREAVLHAIVRKNFGCTHFIVGRDHAGVGKYYGPFDAHRLLESLASRGLGIQPLFFGEVYYCRRCGSLASERSCGHGPEERLTLSGTEVRRRLREGLPLPAEFTRPEVAALLAEAFRARNEVAHG